MTVEYLWRGPFVDRELNLLHAEGFDHRVADDDWSRRTGRHSLGWVTARLGGDLIGFVNLPWDGGRHVFVEDTVVADRLQRHGIGQQLVAIAVEHAREAGCEYVHVDFDDHLRAFYYDDCGFQPTNAGLISLKAG